MTTTDSSAAAPVSQIEPPIPQRATMISASISAEDRYALTLNMRKKYQRTLKVAATLAKKMGMIEGDSIHELMNLFVNLGLEYIKSESLRRQGYK